MAALFSQRVVALFLTHTFGGVRMSAESLHSEMAPLLAMRRKKALHKIKGERPENKAFFYERTSPTRVCLSRLLFSGEIAFLASILGRFWLNFG